MDLISTPVKRSILNNVKRNMEEIQFIKINKVKDIQ